MKAKLEMEIQISDFDSLIPRFQRVASSGEASESEIRVLFQGFSSKFESAPEWSYTLKPGFSSKEYYVHLNTKGEGDGNLTGVTKVEEVKAG